MMTTNALKNVTRTETSFWKLEGILDTRQYDLQTMKPIPGTGDPIPCECCGRSIIIHAYVKQITDRKVSDRAIIGTQCCKKVNLYLNGQSPTNRNYWKRTYA